MIHVRAAGTDDVEQVLELWSVAGENDDRPADDRDVVLALLTRDPQALLLAEEDGELVGTVVAGWGGWRAHLYRLAVHPGHRRRGIASALLRAAEERLVGLGARRLDAMVLEGNVDGQALWARAGFGPQERWRRWVRPTG
ncbi:GNAT family N-acetyltransferase [Actinomycetospora soli]|uniref:GNAT family N-acetyltransferase n=1 Tax=Actinomycetospora soli TaxID=2893887 RepID=UPI001E5CC96E|nr:GNAT family N-acetyltransferase [Actinomycetospora soli]MCD2185533.1 GNAT family N-acetyltransferase [Actinomycetospora soli]